MGSINRLGDDLELLGVPKRFLMSVIVRPDIDIYIIQIIMVFITMLIYALVPVSVTQEIIFTRFIAGVHSRQSSN